eukprot:PhM_4_TR18316/c0_g2_i1/m.74602
MQFELFYASLFGVVLILCARRFLSRTSYARVTALGMTLACVFMMHAVVELIGFFTSDPLYGVVGAAFGMSSFVLLRRAFGSDDNNNNNNSALYIMSVAIHCVAEGVTVGVSAGHTVSVSTALMLHNVPECAAMTATLLAMGMGTVPSAAWTVLSHLPQVVVGGAVGALELSEMPSSVAGAAAGYIFIMVVLDLAPEAKASSRVSWPVWLALVSALSSAVHMLGG